MLNAHTLLSGARLYIATVYMEEGKKHMKGRIKHFMCEVKLFLPGISPI